MVFVIHVWPFLFLDPLSLCWFGTSQMLETVVPKTGGVVMIVGGKSDVRGMRGSLLHKNKEAETASVQLLGEDMRIETVSLDDIAEFVGRQDDMLD